MNFSLLSIQNFKPLIKASFMKQIPKSIELVSHSNTSPIIWLTLWKDRPKSKTRLFIQQIFIKGLPYARPRAWHYYAINLKRIYDFRKNSKLNNLGRTGRVIHKDADSLEIP